MSKESSLSKYTGAMEALKAHQDANKAIFDQHKILVNNVIDAENDLRDAVAEAGEGVSDGTYKVTVTPQTQTWADIEELDNLIARGWLDGKYRDKVVKTQQRPPRISITEMK